MKKHTLKNYLFILSVFILSTCSAVPRIEPSPENTISPAVSMDPTTSQIVQSPTATFLPVILNSYPYFSVFGVDGKSFLDKMGSAQVDWLRLNTQLRWSDIESVQGTYDWSKAATVESLLKTASENKMQVILLIQTAPKWARKYPDSICGPIKDEEFSAFGNFLYEVVRRYSQPPYNVLYYQIWNEPDGFRNDTISHFGCWADGSDEYYGGRAFGRMLAQVYPRIKQANPNAQVILGSLMMLCDPRDNNPTGYCADPAYRMTANFFEGVVREAKGAFDIVAFNSGPSFKEGENPVWSELNNWRWESERGGLVNGKISYLREVMSKYGEIKPIIHTEAYLLDRPEGSYSLFEQYKADYLVWVYANGWAQNLKAVTWYSIEGWKGSELIRRDGQETEAFQVLKAMIGLLKNARYVMQEEFSGYSRFIFRFANKEIWLLIPTGQSYGQSYTLAKPSNFERVLNLMGEEQIISGDSITFNRPTYVILNY